jgi:hypothetical protein
MKRSSLKEVLLLILPTLILLSASFWWQKREQRDAVKESGPFRLEVAKVEKVTLTPAEVAEGYDTKFLVTFAYWGDDPLLFYRQQDQVSGSKLIASNFSVKAREKNHWSTIPITTVSRTSASATRCLVETTENQISIALPLSQLPKKELRLEIAALAWLEYRVPKGSVRSQINRALPNNKQVVVSPSPNFKGSDKVEVRLTSPVAFVTARKVGKPAPEPQVSRARSLSLISAGAIQHSPLFMKKVNHFSNDNL